MSTSAQKVDAPRAINVWFGRGKLHVPVVLRARGAFLLAARQTARLTQAQLAEALGKSQALVSLAERGRPGPESPTAVKSSRPASFRTPGNPRRQVVVPCSRNSVA